MSLRRRLTGFGRDESENARGPSPSLIQGELHHTIVTRLAEEQEEIGPAGGQPDQRMKQRVVALAEELLDREYPDLSTQERGRIVEEICHDIFAYGPITPLLNDPEVSEVMVNGPNSVYAERGGRVFRTPFQFRDTRHLMSVVERILAPLGRRVDESSPMVDARLPDGSRVNVITPPVCLNGTTITIRKFKDDGFSMETLVSAGSVTRQMAQFLKCCVEARLNVIVSGGTGSGKTTMLNALSSFIPADERVVTIEDAAELRLRQGHVISLESRPPNGEGRGEVTIRDLLRNALRMRPDRIVIGEVRGGEALDLLQAMNTGHDGSLSTLHANKPRDALARLETMALMANFDLPVRAIREQMASSIDLIVHQERFEDGSRRIAHVAEVQGMEGDVITLHEVFLYERTGLTSDGKVKGRFTRSPVRPLALERFRRFGLPFTWSDSDGDGVR
jgi:pilus assembly protein CpaF